MSGENITGVLAVLGSILSVVSVLYGIAQALQKADGKYVASLQARVLEDGKRITALERSLENAGVDRQKLTSDLVSVTELLMEAQKQLADNTHDIRSDIATTTDVAREAVAAADKAYHEANTVNEKIAGLHEQLDATLKQNTETLKLTHADRDKDKDALLRQLDDAVPPRERDTQ